MSFEMYNEKAATNYIRTQLATSNSPFDSCPFGAAAAENSIKVPVPLAV